MTETRAENRQRHFDDYNRSADAALRRQQAAKSDKPKPKAKPKPKPPAKATPAPAAKADPPPADKPEPKSEPARPAPSAPGGSAFSIPPLVTWTLVSVGVWLIFCALRGLSPLDEIKAALGGKKSPGKKYDLAAFATANGAVIETDTGAGGLSYSSRAGSQSPTADPSNLVSVHGVRLAPIAAEAFKAWEAAYGGPITAAGWRSYADQADGYAKDPDRFAPPDKSWHVKGLAVDVDLETMKADPNVAGSNWQKLYTAAMATGWCNPRGPYKGDHKEPWHFSSGGCG